MSLRPIINSAAFRRAFAVATESLSAESRAVAWSACFSGNRMLRPRVVGIYLSLARSKPPYLPRSGE